MIAGMSVRSHRRRAIRNKIRITAKGATTSATMSTASLGSQCWNLGTASVVWGTTFVKALGQPREPCRRVQVNLRFEGPQLLLDLLKSRPDVRGDLLAQIPRA
jgi:hypothetical protein